MWIYIFWIVWIICSIFAYFLNKSLVLDIRIESHKPYKPYTPYFGYGDTVYGTSLPAENKKKYVPEWNMKDRFCLASLSFLTGPFAMFFGIMMNYLQTGSIFGGKK